MGNAERRGKRKSAGVEVGTWYGGQFKENGNYIKEVQFRTYFLLLYRNVGYSSEILVVYVIFNFYYFLKTYIHVCPKLLFEYLSISHIKVWTFVRSAAGVHYISHRSLTRYYFCSSVMYAVGVVKLHENCNNRNSCEAYCTCEVLKLRINFWLCYTFTAFKPVWRPLN